MFASKDSIDTRTLDDRCQGYALEIVKLIENRYKGESLSEQQDLLNEIDSKEYRETMLNAVKKIYQMPMTIDSKKLALILKMNEYESYRSCVRLNTED